MSLKSKLFISVSLLVTLLACIKWLSGPVLDSRSGVAVRFLNSDGEYLSLYGLTIRVSDSISRGEQLSRGWLKFVPARVSEVVFANRLGKDQGFAREAGFIEGERLAGKLSEVPVLIHPGEVSGSSTGLAWGLAYIASKEPRFIDLNVSSTGTLVYRTGVVVGVAGIESKLVSDEVGNSDIVFVPHRQRDHAIRSMLVRYNTNESPVVVGVRSIDEAVGVLCVLNKRSFDFCGGVIESFENSVVSLSNENLGICKSLRNKLNRSFSCVYSTHENAVYLSRVSK